MLCFGGLFLAACSDDDNDYMPAEPVKAGCQQVHFAASNSNTAILDSTKNEREVQLLCVRNTTSGTITVPVEIVSQAGVTAASTVTFADGDSTAYLTLTAPEAISTGQSYAYEVRLTGDEVDPYAMTAGSNIFSGIISFPVTRVATMSISGHSGDLGYWKQDVFDLGGGKYYIANLMRSGVLLYLTVNSDNTLSISSPDIDDLCLENNVYDTGDQIIYLCDPDLDYAYYVFYTSQAPKPFITDVQLYNASGYAGWVEDGQYFYIALCTVSVNGGNDEYWKYLYLQFKD